MSIEQRLSEITAPAKESGGREFWLELVRKYGDPCDFVHDKPTEHCMHVIEYSAFEQMKRELDELLDERRRCIHEDVHWNLCEEYKALTRRNAELGEHNRMMQAEMETNQRLLKERLAQTDALRAELANVRSDYEKNEPLADYMAHAERKLAEAREDLSVNRQCYYEVVEQRNKFAAEVERLKEYEFMYKDLCK